ncbi:MAG: hypothetical protein ACRCV9_17885 [Burkholderiaceae bacterium]
MSLQAMFDGMSQQWQRERADTQMTLGSLIDALEKMETSAPVANLCNPHSYRGYYIDLAFAREEGMRPAGELLAECCAAMGAAFQGYKGGSYVMSALTPVWVAEYGSCGVRLIALTPEGDVLTKEDEF